ncbi:MAG TPA: isoprenyl transferase [Longilinea sp.]|nr:isoprenyl transferase [Longilinea sp.]
MSQSSTSNPPADLPLNIPTHVAIIMDGNGRWATARGLPRMMGHRAGTENLRRIIQACVEFGIKYLTIYAFSTENWGRPSDEVEGLMHILSEVIDNELDELNNEGVQIRHIGRIDRMQENLRKKVLHAVESTRENRRLVLCVAWNYGGRDEIVYAIQHLIAAGRQIDEIDEDLVSQNLFTVGIPDPDLVIRTSGEIRISNFLTWQAAYSEWYFTPTLWPDFDKVELLKALEDYSQRDRRFGRLSTSGC